jgi:hypothetical protein
LVCLDQEKSGNPVPEYVHRVEDYATIGSFDCFW